MTSKKMIRVMVVLYVLVLTVLPVTVWGATFRAGEEIVNVSANETIDDDLYIGAGTVVIDATVNGDVYVGGGQITINGPIKGDLVAGGGQITLRGEVEDDVRVAGGSVMLMGTVKDDVFMAGGNLSIGKDAVIEGDTHLGGGQVELAGSTRDVNAGVGTLVVAKTARINGDLTYVSDREAIVQDGATISGKLIRHTPPAGAATANRRAFSFGLLASLLGTALIAWLFNYFVPNKTKFLSLDWRNRFGMNLLVGVLFVIVTPIVSIVLLATILGLPLGIMGIFGYGLLLYLGYIVGTIAVGTWLLRWWQPELSVNWQAIVLGVLIMTFVGQLPIIGWIIWVLVALAGIGVLLRFDWNLVQELRATNRV